MSDKPASQRRDLRSNEREWTGMSAQHRQSSLRKPYLRRTKEGNVWPFLKRLFIVIIILVIAQELYSMRQECMSKLGENSIYCID